jgi:hypothetical protein
MNTRLLHKLWAALTTLAMVGAILGQLPGHSAKIETTYDSARDKTTVRLAPVKISGDKDKYHSLQQLQAIRDFARHIQSAPGQARRADSQ